jgi:4'-phosphopantetheinyl transferase
MPAVNDVRVWYAETAPLAADPARVTRLLDWLEPDERARFDRYRFDADRLMFLLGRHMARELVGRELGCAPTWWRWREGPNGRPEIDAPGTSLHFNLAHSAGLVACALASGREVGVDVEDLQRAPSDPALVRRFCSPDEAADVEAQGDRWRDRFLTYWTLKEAYLKARGVGISVTLSDISFSLEPDGVRVSFLRSLEGTDPRWTFTLVRPTDRHLLAVAVPNPDGQPAVVSASRF